MGQRGGLSGEPHVGLKLEIIRNPLGIGTWKEDGFEVFRGGEEDGDGLLA